MKAVLFDIVVKSKYEVKMESEYIQIKLNGPAGKEIKASIEEAARRRGRKTGPWLVYLAALADPKVAETMGIDANASDSVKHNQ